MRKVFISGSITIKRLDPQVRARLDNILGRQLPVLVGDAGGVDSAVQRYLLEHGHGAVTVYCSGEAPRNNLGAWPLERVPPPAGLRGRALYTLKDVRMAEDCDLGLMIWDGKSPGTLSNVVELLQRGKTSVVYLHRQETFHNIQSAQELQVLLEHMDPAALQEADKKTGLLNKLARLSPPLAATVEPASGDLQAQIEQHRAAIAHHQQCIEQLQATLAIASPIDDLFSD